MQTTSRMPSRSKESLTPFSFMVGFQAEDVSTNASAYVKHFSIHRQTLKLVFQDMAECRNGISRLNTVCDKARVSNDACFRARASAAEEPSGVVQNPWRCISAPCYPWSGEHHACSIYGHAWPSLIFFLFLADEKNHRKLACREILPEDDQGKANSSCCPLRPRTTPFPE